MVSEVLLLLAVIALVWGACWWASRRFPDTEHRDCCPTCGHSCGPDQQAAHCAEVEDISGWAWTTCDCTHPFHAAQLVGQPGESS